MQAIPFEDTVAKKFRLEQAPTLFAHREGVRPIAFTRLRAEGTFRGTTMTTPPDASFTFQVAVGPMPVGDIWIGGRHSELPAAAPGDTFVFDLGAYPTANLHPPFDFVRFFMPNSTMEQMAYDRGLRRIGGLRANSIGIQDSVMHGLALALMPALREPSTGSALFLDAMALAVHAHAVHAYGGVLANSRPLRSGLAPWQLRRVNAYIEAHLDGDPSIAELARECGLSSSYFARAFNRSTGMPPHRWLMKLRMERAKALLLAGELEIAQVASVCGFFDQSHLNRTFVLFESCTPARWRRQRRS